MRLNISSIPPRVSPYTHITTFTVTAFITSAAMASTPRHSFRDKTIERDQRKNCD